MNGIKLLLYFLGIGLLSWLLAIWVKPEEPLHIGILHYTSIDKNLSAELLKNISATYNCSISEIPGIATLPSSAFYEPRGRYKASLLLKSLKTIPGYDRVLGITHKDISTTKGEHADWGVLGLGYMPGKACVISTFRMKTQDKLLFNERFIKVALHELGHTMGLPHCGFSAACFMADADGTIKSVDMSTKFLCSNCKKMIPKFIKT